MSPRWNNDDAHQVLNNQEHIFVDQDPKPFGILLAYMRSGRLNLPQKDPQLCEAVLLQAEFLGMEIFLNQVKVTTYKNLRLLLLPQHPLPSTDDEIASAFDENFGSVSEAITEGILPRCYYPPTPTLEIHTQSRVFHVPKVTLVKKSIYFARLLVQKPTDYWLESHHLYEDPIVVEFAFYWIMWGKFPARRMFEMCGQNAIAGLDPQKQVMLVVRTLMTDVAICLQHLGTAFTPEEFDKAMTILAYQMPK